ncbi:hypothetical protein LINPERPRIM_LOCUS32798 [Linum perenne]
MVEGYPVRLRQSR